MTEPADPPRLGDDEHRRAESLFHDVVELAAEARAERLARPDVDPRVRREVESLLAHAAGDALDEPAPALVGIASGGLVGQRVNHYDITGVIGEGGMGRVYVARDTNLDRDVAIKVLPRNFAADGEVRLRFEREAKVVAALNHPNIVTAYSFESSDEGHLIVMEFVRGQTLTDTVPRDGCSLREFFAIAIPLADAIGAAHAQDILHRDLKPDNVMVNESGRVKVLDFGLAKLRQDASFAAARATDVTKEGRIMGTVAYLSPEQAEGKVVDHRSDVFALGVLMYEMLAGRRPFQGDSNASLISSILKDDPPPLMSAKADLPRGLGRILTRCLEKHPSRRYQSAFDLRRDLEDLREELGSGEVVVPASTRRANRRVPVVPWLLVAALAASTGYLWFTRDRGPAPDAPIERLRIRQLTDLPGIETDPALAPDGKHVVYSGNARGNFDLYLQRVGAHNATNLTEGESADDSNPRFSPDGEHIAFRSERDGGGIFVMGATGESVRRVSSFGHDPAWSPDGKRLVVATERIDDPGSRYTTSQLWSIDVDSGERSMIYGGDAVQPDWSPHGHRVAFWAITGGRRDVWTIDSRGGEPVPVTEDVATDFHPRWSPDGRSLYFASDRGGSVNLWRVPIDERTGRRLGPARAVTAGAAEASHPSLSADGRRVAFISATLRGEVRRRTFSADTLRAARDTRTIITGTKSVPMEGFHVSRSGEWLAYGTQAGQEDIFVASTDGDERRRRQLTDDVHRDRRPRWSPDGEQLAFYSNRSGSYEIWTINRDGSGLRQRTDLPDVSLYNPVWMPDGKRILAQGLRGTAQRVYAIELDGDDPAGRASVLLPAWQGEGRFFEVSSCAPAGDRLAGFVRDHATGRPVAIALYTFATESYRDLGPFEGEDRSLSWTPGGDRLLAVTEASVVAIDVADGARRPIDLGEGARPHAVEVAGDGRTLLTAHRTRRADVWILSAEPVDPGR